MYHHGIARDRADRHGNLDFLQRHVCCRRCSLFYAHRSGVRFGILLTTFLLIMISRSIKNVTVAGVSLSNSKYVHLSNCLQITGAIGPSIIHSLNAAGFRVQALTRRRQTTSIPNAVNVVEVNYNDDNALRKALRYQDAVVSCLGDVPAAVQAQESLLKAALDVGVKRFLPSEFGSDTTNRHVRSYPFFRAKVEHQRRLRQAASAYRDFSYSLLITGPFIDWGLSKVPFIINVGARTAEGIVSLIMACWRITMWVHCATDTAAP